MEKNGKGRLTLKSYDMMIISFEFKIPYFKNVFEKPLIRKNNKLLVTRTIFIDPLEYQVQEFVNKARE